MEHSHHHSAALIEDKIVGWFSDLSKTAQGFLALVTLVVVTGTASAGAVHFFAAPDSLNHTQLQAQLKAVADRHQEYERLTGSKLNEILVEVKSLDLRLCLEQAQRDATDARLCAKK